MKKKKYLFWEKNVDIFFSLNLPFNSSNIWTLAFFICLFTWGTSMPWWSSFKLSIRSLDSTMVSNNILILLFSDVIFDISDITFPFSEELLVDRIWWNWCWFCLSLDTSVANCMEKLSGSCCNADGDSDSIRGLGGLDPY